MIGRRAHNRRLLGAFIAASAGVIFAGPVSAADGDGTDTLETVYVTARKQSEDLQKVPLPVTVLSGEALADSNDTQIQQLALKAPDLLVTQSNARQTSFGLRGLGNNPISDGLSTSVGVYMDGVYLDRPGMAAFDLLDIAQIEVLRGPQGTLFGKNTTAGAITITTLAPEFDYGATGTFRAGNLGLHQAHFSVTGPMSNVLAFRLSGYDTDRNGYLKDVYDGRRLLSLHRQGLRGQLLYRPSANFSWRMIAEYGREQDSSGAAVLYSTGPSQSANPTFVPYDTWAGNLGITPITDPTLLENTDNAPQQITDRQYALTSLITAQLGALTLDSVTGWRAWRYEPHIDLDYTSADAIRDGGNASHVRQFSQELRLSGTMSTITYVAGGYFFWRNILGGNFTTYGSQYSQGLGILGNPALNNGTTHTYTDLSNRSYAAFLQGIWHFAPQWNFTAGLRETYETESGTITRTAFTDGSGPPPPNFGAYNGSLSTDEWTPSALLSADYAVSDGMLAYASSSYGAKAGGFNPTVPSTGNGTILSTDTLKVKPERMADFELGLKSELLDRHVILNLDGYWGTVAGYQTSAVQILPNNQRKTSVTNAGSVLTQGIEADVTAKLSSEIQLKSSLSYNDAHYVTFTNGPAAEGSTAPTQDLSGRPLLLAPAWTVFAGIRYSRPLAPGISGYVAGEFTLKTSYYGYPDDSAYVRVPSTAMGNLQLGLTIGLADIAMWVDNISDERSFTPVFPPVTGSGGYMANPGEPRTFGLTLRYTVQ
jgi:iron complex outermembrane receptor protein